MPPEQLEATLGEATGRGTVREKRFDVRLRMGRISHQVGQSNVATREITRPSQRRGDSAVCCRGGEAMSNADSSDTASQGPYGDSAPLAQVHEGTTGESTATDRAREIALRAKVASDHDDLSSLASLARILIDGHPDEAAALAERVLKTPSGEYEPSSAAIDVLIGLKAYDLAAELISVRYDGEGERSFDRAKLLGRVLYMQDHDAKALEVLSPFADQLANDLRTGYYYASALYLVDRDEDAEAFCHRVLDDAPANVQFRDLLSRVYLARKKHDEAIVVLNDLVSVEGEKTRERLLRLGKAQRGKGLFDDAHRTLDELIALCGESAEFYIQKGETYERQHERELALAMFDKAIAIQDRPDDHSLAHRAIALFRLGRLEDAIAALRKIPEGEFKLSALANLVVAYQLRKEFTKSLSCIDEAIKRNEKNEDFYVARGVSLAGLGRYAEALATYDKAESLGFSYGPLLAFNRAVALAHNKCYDAAYEQILKIKGEHEGDFAVQFNRGLIALSLDKYDDALAAFRRANSVDESGKASIGIAETLTQQKRLEDARDAALSALDAGQESALLLLSSITIKLGQRYCDRSYYIDALAYSDRAVRVFFSGPESEWRQDREIMIRALRAVALAELGRLSSAKRELSRQIALGERRGKNTEVARANLRRLNRAAANNGYIPSWLPYAISAIAVVLASGAVFLLWKHLIKDGAFATILLGLLVTCVLTFVIPGLTRLKIGGVELEKIDMGGSSVLHLETSRGTGLFNPDSNQLEASRVLGIDGFHKAPTA